MLYLIVFIIFGALGSALAASKGRNQVIWFVLSFFFPLISLLILACLPSLKTPKAASELANTQLCPACAERIKAQARVCRFCGHNLEQQTLAKALEATETNTDTDAACLPAPEKEAKPLAGPVERRISLIYEGSNVLNAKALFHLEVNGERVLENCNYREAFESEVLSETGELDIKIVNAKTLGIVIGKHDFSVALTPDQHNVLLSFDNVWGKWLEPRAL